MRATGIVRRIDELGRVVIPKEIRRTLRIREGRPVTYDICTKGIEGGNDVIQDGLFRRNIASFVRGWA